MSVLGCGMLLGNSVALPLTANLVLWNDASVTPAGAVASWTDLSGTGNTSTQGVGAAKPICTVNQQNALNGLVFVAASNQTLILPSGIYTLPGSDSTIYVLGRSTNESGTGRMYLSVCNGVGTSGNGLQLADSATAGAVFYQSEAGNGTLSATSIIKTNTHLMTGQRSGTTEYLSINGGGAFTNSNATNVTGVDRAYIGSNNATNRPLNGTIFEILVYSVAHTAAQITQTNNYLLNKWGVLTNFVSSWDTTKAGSANTTIVIPTSSTGTYNCVVNWGDGTTSTITTYNDAAWTHVYAGSGTYQVTIQGTFVGFVFNNGGDKLKLLNVSQWGTGFRLGTTQGTYFYGCSNLTITATDVLNLTGTTSFSSAFRSCAALTTIPSANSWDTSAVTNMAFAFLGTTLFNQNIGSWNTGAVTTMTSMFQQAGAFNQALNSWDVSKVTNMSSMFSSAAAFNSNITGWSTGAVTTMLGMFQSASVFNQAIGSWDVSKVANMQSMFSGATAFNQNITGWNTGLVTSMASMFQTASAFNQNINTSGSSWDVSKVTTMSSMFQSATAFNGNIGSWNTGLVTTMASMFQSATNFNQALNSWDVSKVTTTQSMFSSATAFNSSIVSWNTGAVTTMISMFQSATNFNQAIGSWNTANVTLMGNMFFSATHFNQSIGSWNTSKVTSLVNMFNGASVFNQAIGGWDTTLVNTMAGTFQNAAAFNQDVSLWKIGVITTAASMFTGSAFAITNYNLLLDSVAGWPSQATIPSSIPFSAGTAHYSGANAVAGRAVLTSTKSWVVTDGGTP